MIFQVGDIQITGITMIFIDDAMIVLAFLEIGRTSLNDQPWFPEDSHKS